MGSCHHGADRVPPARGAARWVLVTLNFSTSALLYNSIYVESKTIDKLVKSLNINKIDILKIDVQGNELDVLNGAEKSLSFVDVIMIEINLFDFYGEISKNWFHINNIFTT